MITNRIDIWGPQLEDTFNLPSIMLDEPVVNIDCDIPDTYLWTSSSDNTNIYCFPNLNIPIWVNTRIDEITNTEFISQVVFSKTYWDYDFECFNFNNMGVVKSALITNANSSSRCKINFDHNTNTVNEIDFGNYTRFNTGIGLGEPAETVEDLLFDENYFHEPFNIINDIINRNNFISLGLTLPILEPVILNTPTPN